MRPTDLRTTYSYELPRALVAQEPAERRDQSRLMTLSLESGSTSHHRFDQLPGLLRPADLLVLNDTKVIPARVELRRQSGGRVKGLLLEKPARPTFSMMLEGRGRLAEGDRLLVDGGGELLLLDRLDAGSWRVRVDDEACRKQLLASGRMPLPPYITRASGRDDRDEQDRERYQTIFARAPGAVAAPTAGLHFTSGLLDALRDKGIPVATVTLHVGPGTFLPVRSEDLSDHPMHAESYEVPAETVAAIDRARGQGGRVVAVGTTVVRALESSADPGGVRAGRGETDLFIRPPYEFRVVDGMLTNFHLPESTLLALVCAFAGTERVLAAYNDAVREQYRFYSYGDAMLLL